MRAEQILLAGLILLGIAFVLGGQDLAFRADIAFGPGFVPVLAGAALALCCILQVVRRTRAAWAETVPDGEKAHVTPDYRSLLVALAILIAGVAAMSFGSVLAPVLGMTILLSWLVSGHSLLRSGLVAVAVTATVYMIFVLWLDLPVR